MYLGFKYKGVAKAGFWIGILLKGNACLNNTDRNKIPVKDHNMLVYFPMLPKCLLSTILWVQNWPCIRSQVLQMFI